MAFFRTAIAATVFYAAQLLAASAYAQVADPPKAPGASTAAPSAEMSDGEVRKIDKDSRKITLKHGAIINLDMPGMTMVFQVKDAAMLDTVQVGSKVKFRADRTDGAFVVTSIQAVK